MQTDVILSAIGSARVQRGGTDVLVGIKVPRSCTCAFLKVDQHSHLEAQSHRPEDHTGCSTDDSEFLADICISCCSYLSLQKPRRGHAC